MKLYFDTEFTGLHKDTTLISIGIVSDDNQKFYAEFTDYDWKQCDKWIKKNVLNNLRLNPLPWSRKTQDRLDAMRENGWEISQMPRIPTENSLLIYDVARTAEDGAMEVCGGSRWVSWKLRDWLSQFDSIQFVSDICHYDFVLLIDLFGTAFDLPENVSPVCIDINYGIAKYFGISEKDAFDMSREEIVKKLCGYEISGKKHNSLYDAEVIKAIYDRIYCSV